MAKLIVCYFCGLEGRQSVEHFFPKWSRKLLPIKTNVKAGYYCNNVHAKTTPGSVGAEVTKNVCQKCNNGWMSEVQASARTILEPWLTGRRPTISKVNVVHVVRWALMTHLSMDSYDTHFSYIPSQERERFTATHEPTLNWRVFAGTVAGDLDRGWRHVALNYPAISYHTVILSGASVFLAIYLPEESKWTVSTPTGLFGIWPKIDPAVNISNEVVQPELVRYLPEFTMGRTIISPIIDPVRGMIR